MIDEVDEPWTSILEEFVAAKKDWGDQTTRQELMGKWPSDQPPFIPGDRVRDHRGNLATVLSVSEPRRPGASWRVAVEFDDRRGGIDGHHYYAEVFELWSPTQSYGARLKSRLGCSR